MKIKGYNFLAIGLKITSLLLFLSLYSCKVQTDGHLDINQIKIELDSIKVLDQLYRSEMQNLYTQYGSESKEFKDAISKQNKIDSLNLIYIEDLIQNFGKYPGKSTFGHSGGNVTFLVLQHSGPEIQAKYFNLLEKAANENEINKRSFAMFYDRHLIQKEGVQKFGTQIGTREVVDSISGEAYRENFFYPIPDTSSLDSLRLWNGLSNLEAYLNRYGLSRWNR